VCAAPRTLLDIATQRTEQMRGVGVMREDRQIPAVTPASMCAG